MGEQLKLPFYEVPISCPIQERYHEIVPILAKKISAAQQAEKLNLSYGTIMRRLREFREKGMEGLFAQKPQRQAYTPERVIVTLIYYKCCAPKASDLELARVIASTTGHHIHHQTVKTLLERHFFWKYEEFQKLINYPIPSQAEKKRLEIAKLKEQGFSERTIADLLRTSTKTVRKWLHRAKSQPLQIPLFDYSHAPLNPKRKVYFGTINIILELQKKYAYAYRIQGYLQTDYGINLSENTIKKIMQLNRRLHLAPTRIVEVKEKEIRQGPLKSQRPFEHTFIDIRYLDAKPQGLQLYSCLLLEGLSRTILAGSLTTKQDVGIVLRIYYLAALQFGLWDMVISDHGGQFSSNAFSTVNRRLQINHQMYEKGQPWQNLIESQFGIQARMGEYLWEKCSCVQQAVEIHRQLIMDHNRLPHFAHRFREDQKHSPLQVLAQARGREISPADLHRAFSRMSWNRKIDQRGFIRLNRWKIYVEQALPKQNVQVTYWDGKLRAEYHSHFLAQYNCKWNSTLNRPKSISKPSFFDSPFQSTQLELFDVCWDRHPIEVENLSLPTQKKSPLPQQLKLYFGPHLVA